MNSEKMKAFLLLSRPVNVLITFVSIPVACWIAGGTLNEWLIILFAATTGALVTAGANAINDSFDIEIDKINKPDRPLPKGILSQSDAKLMWFLTSVIALFLNIFTNLLSLLIVAFSIVLLYFYSAKLKRTIVVGNFVVGMMTGMAFIYGGVAVGTIERSIMPALFAFFSNFARELIKDVEDVEGDKSNNAITLPVKYGIKPALMLATISLSLLVFSTIYAMIVGIYSFAFFSVLIADLLIVITILSMWQNHSVEKMKIVSNNLKLVMIVGLISIILGSI